jgi:hypothetical protein
MIEQLDLVDEMHWEDSDKIEFVSLEDAGLENRDYDNMGFYFMDEYFEGEM